MIETGTFVGGRYEILGEIGAGGMSNVYKAMDHKLNRYVAVKVLKQEFCEDTTFIKKFQTEAQAAAVLTHPNIVNVFDVGEDSGVYYIVMELVEGITLKNYIAKKGKLSVKEATSIAIQVAMGLEAAHSHGIVHRDVKPQNIIISTDGKVKVTDFGIARAASTNTISSNVMGSVHYSSPEQVRGGYSDAKSDIYSLGITMYEMVTGHVPFDGETTVAIAIKHLQDEMVPPSYYTPDLPHSLEQIILKCTQKSVDKRYNSIDETIADLKHSLINPDGDFVQLNTSDPTEQTTVFDENEMQQIKDSRNQTQTETPEEEPSYMVDDDDDDNGGIHHGLERAMMIGGFVVGAVIIVVLVIFIINVTGLFNFSDVGQEDESEVAEEDMVQVPDLCGLTEDEAVELAGEYGIGIQWNGEETSETYAAGLISSQEIDPGTEVERYTTVKYKLSTGVASIAVPNVVGYDEVTAEQTLSNMGFAVSVSKSYGTDQDEGTVLSQTPASGADAQAGDTIAIEVSMGSEYSGFTIPNVIGMTEGDAKSELAPLIVTVQSTTSSDDEAGLVLAQSVAEGVWVDKGTDITITVGAGSGENAAAEQAAGTGTGVWKCTQQLDTPTGYTGGLIKLELVQNVNGSPQATTIVDGEQLTFPYQLDLTGAAGVTEGTLYLSELINGEYVDLGHYTITFEQVSE